MIRIKTILFGLILLTSCDCYRELTGTIVDGASDHPLQSVRVSINDENNSTLTDSIGTYRLSIIESGLKCYCRTKKQLVISKDKYVSDTIAANQALTRMQPIPNPETKSHGCIPDPDTLEGQTVHLAMAIRPEFPGGQSELLKYLSQNLEFPKEQEEWQGSIYVTFVVDSSGAVKNECIYKRFFEGELSAIELEALRLVKEMPRWSPGKHDGTNVYSRVMLPIKFRRE